MELISLGRAAKILEIHRSTFWRIRRAANFKEYKIRGSIRLDRDEVESWIAKQQIN